MKFAFFVLLLLGFDSNRALAEENVLSCKISQFWEFSIDSITLVKTGVDRFRMVFHHQKIHDETQSFTQVLGENMWCYFAKDDPRIFHCQNVSVSMGAAIVTTSFIYEGSDGGRSVVGKEDTRTDIRFSGQLNVRNSPFEMYVNEKWPFDGYRFYEDVRTFIFTMDPKDCTPGEN